MSTRRQIFDDELNDVVGGLIDFNANTNVLTYINPDDLTDVSKFTINPDTYNEAFAYSNEMHTRGMRESTIIANMKYLGYIK